MGTWIFPMENYLDFTNSILPVLLVLIIYMAIRKIRPGKPTVVSAIFGLLFSVCMVFGAQLDQNGSVPFTNPWMWLAILVFAAVITVMVSGLWKAMASGIKSGTSEQYSTEDITNATSSASLSNEQHTIPSARERLCFLLRTSGVILLLYFVVFLAVYPGFFVYDAQDEYLEVVTRTFTTHHPLLHVLMLGGIIRLVEKVTGAVNYGIAAYTLFQMTVMSLIFGYLIWKLKEHGLGKKGQWILAIYLGICPPLVMFSLCSSKDGLFMGMLLIQVLLLLDLCQDAEGFLKNKKKMVLFAAASVLMMLLRHNGFYAFLIFLPILVIFVLRRGVISRSGYEENTRKIGKTGHEWNTRKGTNTGNVENTRKTSGKLLVYGILVIFLYLLLNKCLIFATRASDGEHQEILTVPIMQLARTYAYEPDAFSEEDREVLFRYLPENALQSYTPKVSDMVKVQFSNTAYEENSGDFWKLWWKTLLKHPFSYLNAWMMTSYGFWYPDTIIDVYRGNPRFTYVYEDSSYFGFETEEPGKRNSFLPAIEELYRRMSLTIFQQKIPIISMLFSPGFLFWCMMFELGFLLNYRKRKGCMELAVPFMLPMLIFLTFLLGPTYLVRYVVYWWVLVPLLAIRIYAILKSQYE